LSISIVGINLEDPQRLVRVYGREALLWFEFPKLYRKLNLPLVEDLGRPGWQETAEAR
jgi:hypothetical protein